MDWRIVFVVPGAILLVAFLRVMTHAHRANSPRRKRDG